MRGPSGHTGKRFSRAIDEHLVFTTCCGVEPWPLYLGSLVARVTAKFFPISAISNVAGVLPVDQNAADLDRDRQGTPGKLVLACTRRRRFGSTSNSPPR